ncbi:MAG TPA: DNA primase [Acidimicrobiales bacterium]|nr:DNA primase [Acidimicrobiales bacterium]
MAIPDEDVAAVRAATDIVALIGEYTPLKRVGVRFTGLCPFHSEKSPSFSVNATEGLYYCFGCGASGDAITFLRAIEGCSFVEAVERLGARSGVQVRNDAGDADRAARDRKNALYRAMEEAVAFYHDRLLHHDDAARARQYLRSRGLDGETVRQFALGWAPEGGNHLIRAARSSASALAGAGLVVQGSYGPRDAFRGRIIFPIYQPDGKPVALGGRLVPGVGSGEGPKYRNSPETPIYQKRSTLYGLHLSRQAIVQTGEVIVCEGYTDVIGMFRVGLGRAVATCGTSLTEEHFRLLARFGRRIVLAFDADGAGQSAAARFYEWERRHEVEVAVADLPEGEDPGDLATSDPDRLREAVRNAKTYLQFRLERALAAADLRHPEGRARAAETAVAVVAEHPNELVRDQYLMQVADQTRLDHEQLRQRLEAALRAKRTGSGGSSPKPASTSRPGARDGPRAPGGAREAGATAPVAGEEPPPYDEPGWEGRPASARPRPSPSKPARATPGERAGRDALALAIHDPQAMAGRIAEPLFTDPLQRAAFRALAGADDLHEAIETSDDAVSRLLVELANTDPPASPDQVVVALVRARATEAVSELHAEARRAQANGDEERALQAARLIAWCKAELEVFGNVGAGDHPPRAVTEAADRLLAWLSGAQGETR